MRQEKISYTETTVKGSVLYTIRNAFTNKSTIIRFGKGNNDIVEPGKKKNVVCRAGEPLEIWLEAVIPETIPFRIDNNSASGSAYNYTFMVNRFYDDANETPRWQVILTGPGFAKNMVSRTAANVTVGDGEPPDIGDGENRK